MGVVNVLNIQQKDDNYTVRGSTEDFYGHVAEITS